MQEQKTESEKKLECAKERLKNALTNISENIRTNLYLSKQCDIHSRY